MASSSRTATFKAENMSIPFSLDVDDDGFVMVPEQLLCLRFKLQKSSLLIEKRIFGNDGGVTETVYQKPIVGLAGLEWRVGPGIYSVLGFAIPHSSQPSAITPCTATSVVQDQHPVIVKLEHSTTPIFCDLSDSGESADDVTEKTDVPVVCPSFSICEPDIQMLGEYAGPTPSTPNVQDSMPQVLSSVVDCLKRLHTLSRGKNPLRTVDYESIRRESVRYLPAVFDGDVLFELPPAQSTTGSVALLQGMEARFDGHAWTKIATSKIMNPWNLSFRQVHCLGHLCCMNDQCPNFTRSSLRNEMYWDGFSTTPFDPSRPPPTCSVVCSFCKISPICKATCNCTMYYVGSKSLTMTRACIHFGQHHHPVAAGDCRESIDIVKKAIEDEISKTPHAKPSAIAMAAGKELLSLHLFSEEGSAAKLKGSALTEVLEKFSFISTPNVRNVIANSRHSRGGYIDNILTLKKNSKYDYIQDSVFPGQGQQHVYVFKMSTEGPGSGVDLVKRMQQGGDLEKSWIMFDHVKRVKDWTTLACHVYDSAYCKVMTIAVCDMQSETTAAQVQMWTSLVSVMKEHGIQELNFKGFMADSAQANFNAVRKIFGSGDPSKPMENRERTCTFHWTVSLTRHTKQLIKQELQAEHLRLCQEYRRASTLEEAETSYATIRAWWFSSGAASEDGLRELNDWLGFWHFRYRQWGSYMTTNLTLEEQADMPTCNLSETVHNKWLQQSGKNELDLYGSTLDDYMRALMQSTQYFNFLKGKRGGTGPDKKELKLRAATRSGDPKRIAEAVTSFSSDIPINSRIPHLEGERIFGSCKRRLETPPGDEGDSHRHDRVNYSMPKLGPTLTPHQRKSLSHGNSSDGASSDRVVSYKGKLIRESACSDSAWHIARIDAASKVTCFGFPAPGKKRCPLKIAKHSKAVAAPTYVGVRKKYGTNENESVQMWFCPDDVKRCAKGTLKQWILFRPPFPLMWPVKQGTILTQVEVNAFEEAGFHLEEQEEQPSIGVTLLEPLPRPPFGNADSWPTMRDGKQVRRTNPSVEHDSKMASARLLKTCKILKYVQVPPPGYGMVYTIETDGSRSQNKTYDVTIGDFPSCTCLDFISMKSTSLGKRGKWIPCKHVYYILIDRMGCTSYDQFIHYPTWSFSEVQRVLARATAMSEIDF